MEGLNIRKELRELGDKMLADWGEELIGQGYNLTGKLIKSLEYKIKKRRGEWRIDFFVESYGLIRDRGVTADKIPFGGRSRVSLGKSKFIQALIRFVRRRLRIGGKKGRRIAFAIANTQSLEGSPTKRSFRFSKNGRRKGWIENGIGRDLKELERLLDKLVGRRVEVLMDSIFEEGSRRAA